jgi:hypothetical protein
MDYAAPVAYQMYSAWIRLLLLQGKLGCSGLMHEFHHPLEKYDSLRQTGVKNASGNPRR